LPFSVKRWLLFLFFLGFFLRLPGLFANTFHADEALFTSWARWVRSGHDPFLLTQQVDKPPLLVYLQTAVFLLFPPTAMWSARLPNWIASLLLPLLLGRKVWRWFGEGETAVIATLFLTLAPLAIQFSPTAFTDPLLTFFLWLSLPEMERRQTQKNADQSAKSAKSLIWSGFFFGCALLTKHQAWLFLPLIVAMGWLLGWQWQDWRRWLAGWLPLFLLLVGWEVGRNGRFLLWQQQLDNFGGLRLIWSWELWSRLLVWGALGKTAVGGSFIAILLILCLGWLLWRVAHPLDGVFALYVISYLAFHWLLAIPVWDRYWLPLLPLLAVVLGRGLQELRIGRGQTRTNADKSVESAKSLIFIYRSLRFNQQMATILLLLMLPTAVQAQNGRFALGGYPQADDGAAVVGHYLAAQPYGTVLYDHWYSWQWRYHLFNQRVYVSWFPYPEALADDLQVFGGGEGARFLVLPPGDSGQPVRRAVESAGFWLRPVSLPTPTRMTLYEVEKQFEDTQ
jgi:4-amino-4-deoxy-L-arabinose transferase-like glycosyltransferase